MINRRKFLGLAAGAGATLTFTPRLLRAFQASSSDLIRRAIPSSGEMLPAVGLSFSNHPSCADHAALKEILKTFVDNGGTVFDAMHVSNPGSEQFHLTAPRELGIQNKLFWSLRGTPGDVAPQPDAAFVKDHINMLLAAINARSIDLVMLPAHGDPAWLAALKDEKRAGRVRYIGVQVIGDNVYPELESAMRNEPIDFIGVDYDIGNRAHVEDTILPLAQERKIGVMAFFPFGNNGGLSCSSGSNLFGRVGSMAVPEWAAEFDATSWAQFFLKYVLSHPAITVARVGTTKPKHMLDDMAGGVGRLPDETTRKRMAALIDSLPPVTVSAGPQAPQAPGVLSVAVLDRYVGDYKTDVGTLLTFRRYGTTLVLKSEGTSETILRPLSETRFGQGPNAIEFQLDSTGKVSTLTYEHHGQQMRAFRVR